jgi:hypothetical protein
MSPLRSGRQVLNALRALNIVDVEQQPDRPIQFYWMRNDIGTMREHIADFTLVSLNRP